MKKSDIGVIGLAVMGENLVLNMEIRGFHVSVYNRTAEVTEHFTTGRAAGKKISGYTTLEQFVGSLETPRKIMMMVRAGNAVDSIIDQLQPLLAAGDILIDGGNSNYEDTERRVKDVEAKGFYFIGAGVSGGEEGALHGPAIMPGGSSAAWPIVKPILQSIAAKAEDGTPCCDWIGAGGSGHFVKMVHNGIEYGDMQLIAEAYFVMKQMLHDGNESMAAHFEQWNEGKLKSYLIEITARILRHKDQDGNYLIDKILDTAGQKGTGKWSVINSMEFGVPLNLIATAVFERALSSHKELRIKAAKAYEENKAEFTHTPGVMVPEIHDTLYASKLVSYAQGFALIQEASKHFNWNLNFASIARIWREGCIIRSIFLNRIAEAYEQDRNLPNLLLTPYFKKEIEDALPAWKALVTKTIREEVSVPAFSAALNYFYSLTTASLPANMIQAQRDFFGAHTFERTDKARGEFFHENWTGEGGETSSRNYNA